MNGRAKMSEPELAEYWAGIKWMFCIGDTVRSINSNLAYYVKGHALDHTHAVPVYVYTAYPFRSDAPYWVREKYSFEAKFNLYTREL